MVLVVKAENSQLTFSNLCDWVLKITRINFVELSFGTCGARLLRSVNLYRLGKRVIHVCYCRISSSRERHVVRSEGAFDLG